MTFQKINILNEDVFKVIIPYLKNDENPVPLNKVLYNMTLFGKRRKIGSGS
jgi:hypothetical protein